MRGAALCRELDVMGPLQAVWALDVLIRGVLAKDAACVLVYRSFVEPQCLSRDLAGSHLNLMLEAGRAEGCVAAIQCLLAEAAEGGQPGPEADRLLDHRLRELPLGYRRAKARTAKGDAINRLATDPDPGTISNLLNNPRITERIVLGICSRRPTHSAPLEAVIHSAQWLRRYTVKLALVKNPYLAQKYAINLLPYLKRRDLVGVRDDESLPPTLRLAAQRLLDIVL